MLKAFIESEVKKRILAEDNRIAMNNAKMQLKEKTTLETNKISRILREVRFIREKLKQMNQRPSQRSVGTQIYVDPAQQTSTPLEVCDKTFQNIPERCALTQRPIRRTINPSEPQFCGRLLTVIDGYRLLYPNFRPNKWYRPENRQFWDPFCQISQC